MIRENAMNCSSMAAGARLLKHAAGVALLAILAACSAGGPQTSVNQPTSSSSTANSYNGPAA